MVSATLNLTLVSDLNLGADTFQVRLTYDQPMNTSTTPAITFSSGSPSAVAGTLQLDPAQSWWVSSTTYKAVYTVTDVDANVANITVNVAGARDLSIGNYQAPATFTNAFSIDTVDAETPTRATASVAPSATTVTDANVGTDTFTLTITYDQPMNTGRNPTIILTGESADDAGVSAALRFDDTQSWWLSDHTYRAVYNVVDNNVCIRHVNVAVTGVLDAIGNLQNPSTSLERLQRQHDRRPDHRRERHAESDADHRRQPGDGHVLGECHVQRGNTSQYPDDQLLAGRLQHADLRPRDELLG